jgi:hypothetical protein
MTKTQTITITNAVDILAPVRRASNMLGVTLTGKALEATLPFLAEYTAENGPAQLYVEDSTSNNRTWVQPDPGQPEWEHNYCKGSHGPGGVVSMVSDGIGKKGASRYSRISVEPVAAAALALVAQHSTILTIWITGRDLTITAEVS